MKALGKRLDGVKVGDPSVEGVRMGPLAGRAQVGEVRKSVDRIAAATELVYGNPDHLDVVGADAEKGAFFPALLFYAKSPFEQTAPHDVEAFGPVNTVMPYRSVDDAIALAKMGKGSLVGLAVHGRRPGGARGGARRRVAPRAPHAREPRTAQRRARGTARRCRTSCTAGRGAPAAARRWAASAA